MCLIIFTTNLARARVRKTVLEKAFYQNYDGVGIAYLDDGALKVSKGHDIFDDFYAEYSKIRDLVGTGPCLIHFRAKSVGLVNEANTQPVVIRPDLVMAHNGTIEGGKGGDESDSVKLGAVLKRLDWAFPYTKPQLDILSMLCAGRSKLVFFDAKGRHQIVNAQLGKWSRGAWYSDGGDILEYDPVYDKPRKGKPSVYDVDDGDFPGVDDDYGLAERSSLPCFTPSRLMPNPLIKSKGMFGNRQSVMSPQQRADMFCAKLKAKRFIDIDPDQISDGADWREWQDIRQSLVS